MEVLLSSNATVVERLLSSAMETIVLETAIAASKSLALSLLMIGSLPNGSDIFPKASGTTRGFPLTELHPKNVPDPENQDGSNTEDDDDNDDDDDGDEGTDDQDEGEGDEDDSGKEGDDADDPEDEPEANGEDANEDNGGDDDDNGDDDDDNGDDDEDEEDEEEDEEEEEEEEEEIPRPPAKKRK